MTGIFGATLLMSCQDMPAFICYQDIAQQSWDSRDTVHIDIPAMRSSLNEKVAVGVRIANDFTYNKLSLLVTQRDSNNHVLFRDTVNFAFTDSKGRLTQEGFPYIEATQLTSTSLYFQQGMCHTIELTHIMKSMQMDGIHAVGIIVE